MTLDEYIAQAKRDYPNGYSDYIAAEPEDTPEAWDETLEMCKNKQMIINDSWVISSFADMPDWENEKLWTFLGWNEYNFSKFSNS